jgi:hypothetical protein
MHKQAGWGHECEEEDGEQQRLELSYGKSLLI